MISTVLSQHGDDDDIFVVPLNGKVIKDHTEPIFRTRKRSNLVAYLMFLTHPCKWESVGRDLGYGCRMQVSTIAVRLSCV